MEPTEQQLENRRLANQGQQPIDSAMLSSTGFEINPVEPNEPLIPQIPPLELTQPEKEVSAAQKRISELNLQTVGESAFRTGQEGEQGIVEKTQTVQDLEARLASITAEANAIPLQLQEEATGRGITKRGLAPLQTARLRTNAIQAMTTQAQLFGAQGSLSAAYDLVDRATKAKFDPIREELSAKTANLQLLLQSPELSLADTNRANAQLQSINEQQAEIDIQQAKEKAKQEAIVDATKAREEAVTDAIRFGADSRTIQSMQDAETPEEALQIAVENGFVDKSYVLDTKLKEIQIKQQQAELNVYQQYGGLTPAQYLAQIEKQQKEIQAGEQEDKEVQKAQQQSLEDSLVLDTSITQIDGILSSNALDSVVGGTFLTRGTARQKEGFFGKVAGTVAGGLGLKGAWDELSGNADNVVALTQQILDQQFLDKLIAVKSKGATFGALSDNEGNALRNAANAIAGTAIKTGNVAKGTQRVIGYDMSESEFKKQMTQIKTMMNLARQRATGETFTNDEKDLLDTIYGSTVEFNPVF